MRRDQLEGRPSAAFRVASVRPEPSGASASRVVSGEMTRAAVETAVLRSGREKCWQARDAFYKCVEDAGVTYTVETPTPAQCKAARAAYEAACKASWVKHFDLLQDKRLRYLQTLRTNIAKQTQTGAGSQQGKA